MFQEIFPYNRGGCQKLAKSCLHSLWMPPYSGEWGLLLVPWGCLAWSVAASGQLPSLVVVVIQLRNLVLYQLIDRSSLKKSTKGKHYLKNSTWWQRPTSLHKRNFTKNVKFQGWIFFSKIETIPERSPKFSKKFRSVVYRVFIL